MRTLHSLIALGLLCLAGAPKSSAGIYRMTVFGTVTEVQGDNSATFPVSVGDAIQVTIRVDTSVPDSDPDPNLALYAGSMSSIAFSFGIWSGTGGSGDTVIANDFGGVTDVLDFAVSGANTNIPTFNGGGGLDVFFRDLNFGAVLSSDSLHSAVTTNLLSFPERSINFLDVLSGPDVIDIRGSLDDIQIAEIPEPASYSLLVLAIIAGTVLRGRRPTQYRHGGLRRGFPEALTSRSSEERAV